MSTVKRTICDSAKMNRFYSALLRHLSIIKKQRTTFFINVHTETSAVINVMVTGKKGNASITCLVSREKLELEEYWIIAINGKKFYLEQLTDIGSIINTAVTNLRTRVNTL